MVTELTQEYLKKILNYDPETGVFTWKIQKRNNIKIGQIAGRIDSNGHIQIRIYGRSFMAHRLAWLYIHGSFPNNQIDHVNGKRDDNRIANLRAATAIQNAQNRRNRSDNTSGYKGVNWSKSAQKWIARILFDKKRHSLGYFQTPEKAALAYDIAARKYFGKFARVNFPLCHEEAV